MSDQPGENLPNTPPLPNTGPTPVSTETQAAVNRWNSERSLPPVPQVLLDFLALHPEVDAWLAASLTKALKTWTTNQGQ